MRHRFITFKPYIDTNNDPPKTFEKTGEVRHLLSDGNVQQSSSTQLITNNTRFERQMRYSATALRGLAEASFAAEQRIKTSASESNILNAAVGLVALMLVCLNLLDLCHFSLIRWNREAIEGLLYDRTVV